MSISGNSLSLPVVFSSILSKCTESDVDILTRTVWGEARGESHLGKTAVCFVIINRAKKAIDFIAKKFPVIQHPLFGDGSLSSACLSPYQFSCWNKNDKNLKKINNLSVLSVDYLLCRDVCLSALMGLCPDPTSGSTHYHARQIRPLWTKMATLVTEIGNHRFYKDVK